MTRDEWAADDWAAGYRRGVDTAKEEMRAALAERDAIIQRATNVLNNWAAIIAPNDYDRRFIEAMHHALDGTL